MSPKVSSFVQDLSPGLHQLRAEFCALAVELDRVTADSVTVSSPMIQNCSASIVRRFVHSYRYGVVLRKSTQFVAALSW